MVIQANLKDMMAAKVSQFKTFTLAFMVPISDALAHQSLKRRPNNNLSR
jgi:hypothetical protein